MTASHCHLARPLHSGIGDSDEPAPTPGRAAGPRTGARLAPANPDLTPKTRFSPAGTNRNTTNLTRNMPVQLQFHAAGSALQIVVSGTLSRDDYDHWVPEVERFIKEHDKINILFEMHDFHGWSGGALWEDLKFDAKHFRDVNRLAMVGEKTWQKLMTKVCKPFTTAEIRFFTPVEADEARRWIGFEPATDNEPAASSAAPRPGGPLAILETVLYCRDLEAAEAFYAGLLGLELVESKQNRHRFFRCGARMLLVFNPDHATLKQQHVGSADIPKHGAWGRGHIAFGTNAEQIEGWKAFLQQHGLAIESEIAWPHGGRSIYFRDPGQNSVEIATPEIWNLGPQPDLFPAEAQSQTKVQTPAGS